MAAALSSLSAAEYLATPASRPGSTELINGTVVVSEPKLLHARVQRNLTYHLEGWARAGEVSGYVGLPADVPEVWYVDTASRTVLVFRRSSPEMSTFDVRTELGGDEPLTSPLLPGLSLPIGLIFAR